METDEWYPFKSFCESWKHLDASWGPILFWGVAGLNGLAFVMMKLWKAIHVYNR